MPSLCDVVLYCIIMYKSSFCCYDLTVSEPLLSNPFSLIKTLLFLLIFVNLISGEIFHWTLERLMVSLRHFFLDISGWSAVFSSTFYYFILYIKHSKWINTIKVGSICLQTLYFNLQITKYQVNVQTRKYKSLMNSVHCPVHISEKFLLCYALL